VGPVAVYDFLMAATTGRIKSVRKFLDDGGDVNAKDSVSSSWQALTLSLKGKLLFMKPGSLISVCLVWTYSRLKVLMVIVFIFKLNRSTDLFLKYHK